MIIYPTIERLVRQRSLVWGEKPLPLERMELRFRFILPYVIQNFRKMTFLLGLLVIFQNEL